MTCRHCGTTLPAGSLFCGECGRRVDDASDVTQTRQDAPPVAPEVGLAVPAQPRSAPDATAAPVQSAPAAPSPAPSPRDHAPTDGDAAPAATEPPRIPPPPAATDARSGVRDDAAAAVARALAGVSETGVLTGRAEPAPVAPAAPTHPVDPGSGTARPTPSDASGEPPGARPSSPSGHTTAEGPHCEQCGAGLTVGDIFCPECGFVTAAVSAAFTRAIPRISGLPPATHPVTPTSPTSATGPGGPHGTPATPESLASLPPAAELEARVPSAEVPARNETDDTGDDSGPVEEAQALAAAIPTAPSAFVPEEDLDADVEETRLVPRRLGVRFVLQFSTGETTSVHGSGLIGRNPRPEPGEVFDQLVRILDVGRSVSKTHLEFGQEDGQFWVTDRHSGNGTVLREVGTEARRCEPGRRYRISRGTRVEIGEQFFVVS